MRLHCPKCADAIPAKDVNIRELIAKCSLCDNVFEFGRTTIKTGFPRTFEPIKQPPWITRHQTSEELTFTWRWWSPTSIFTFIVSLSGLALYVALLTVPDFFDFNSDEILLLIFVPCYCLFLLYRSIASWFNTTTVSVGTWFARTKHGPFPWPDGDRFQVKDIVQLYVGRHSRQTVWGYSGKFGVLMIDREGNHARAVSSLGSVLHAHYLEQEIEAFLGITDQVVIDELPRDQ